MTLFVDSSVFYAAADSGDRSNRYAKAVLSTGEPLVTSDHVLVEVWHLVRGRISRAAADGFWSGVRAGAASVECVTPADLEAAWHVGLSWPDHDFSIVDRTSFAIMERLSVHRVATFDEHFAVYRFGPGRRRAFEIVR